MATSERVLQASSTIVVFHARPSSVHLYYTDMAQLADIRDRHIRGGPNSFGFLAAPRTVNVNDGQKEQKQKKANARRQGNTEHWDTPRGAGNTPPTYHLYDTQKKARAALVRFVNLQANHKP
jgi:hypothetical protein